MRAISFMPGVREYPHPWASWMVNEAAARWEQCQRRGGRGGGWCCNGGWGWGIWGRGGSSARGGSTAGDVDVVLLDEVGVFGRQAAAHRLADQFALARRQVHEAAVTGDVAQVGLLVAGGAVGFAVAFALGVVPLFS